METSWVLAYGHCSLSCRGATLSWHPPLRCLHALMNYLFSRPTGSAPAVSPHGRCSRAPTRSPPTPSTAPPRLPPRPVPLRPALPPERAAWVQPTAAMGRGGSRDYRPVQRERVPCNVHATAITPPQPAVPLPCYEAHPVGTYQRSGGRGGSQQRRVTTLCGGDHFRSGSASPLGPIVLAAPCGAAKVSPRRPLGRGKSREEPPVLLNPFPQRDGDGPSHRARAPAPPRAASFPDRRRCWVRGARARTGGSGRGASRYPPDMSVAFAAPRQRGKGEITPAAIQKVRRARGGGPGPARAAPGAAAAASCRAGNGGGGGSGPERRGPGGETRRPGRTRCARGSAPAGRLPLSLRLDTCWRVPGPAGDVPGLLQPSFFFLRFWAAPIAPAGLN